jgi:hypothetical protein
MTCAMTKHSSLDVGTLPYWTDSASLPTFSPIDRDIDVDVAVIGGGITGLTTAYLLLSAGSQWRSSSEAGAHQSTPVTRPRT